MGKFQTMPGGYLLLSVLMFFLDFHILFILTLNVLIHELGHLWMLRRFGVRIRSVTLELTGLCIRYSGAGMGRYGEFLCAAAGPMFGVAFAFLASILGNLLSCESLLLFAGTGALLSAFNLLPAAPLDGWRMLRALLPTAAVILSPLCGMLVLAAGIAVMVRGYGTALAFLGLFLLLRGGERERIPYLQ